METGKGLGASCHHQVCLAFLEQASAKHNGIGRGRASRRQGGHLVEDAKVVCHQLSAIAAIMMLQYLNVGLLFQLVKT